MTRGIVFWGASGHARVLRELCNQRDYELLALFDNDPTSRSPFKDVPVYHGAEGFRGWRKRVPNEDIECLVAIGGEHGRDRIALQRFMVSYGLRPAVVVHATAFVAPDATLGPGSQVLAQAAVCVGAKVGQACIINTRASVDHECFLGDGVHLAPGATLAGCVSVGEASLIGPSGVVLPRIRIGANVIIGAGAVVTRDMPDNVVAYGNPARIIRNNPTRVNQ
jgi:sugar O-acyltransferase (sialic acid O-acetyltransferase NeuD family)